MDGVNAEGARDGEHDGRHNHQNRRSVKEHAENQHDKHADKQEHVLVGGDAGQVGRNVLRNLRLGEVHAKQHCRKYHQHDVAGSVKGFNENLRNVFYLGLFVNKQADDKANGNYNRRALGHGEKAHSDTDYQQQYD